MPSPTTGSVPFETGLESDEFGQVAITLPIEIGIGMLLLGETLPIALTGAAVAEGSLLLGSGIAYVHEQLSPQQGTCDVRPVQVPQGLVMGEGTDYVVTVSNGSTTIQVIDGSVIFVDQYTNNSITVGANQMLALPSGVKTGFSVQDLQVSLSAFDASSLNQWWTQITPTSTVTTTITITATPTTSSANRLTNFPLQSIVLPVILLAVMIVIAAVLVTTRRKAHQRRFSSSNQKSNDQNPTQPSIPNPPMNENPKTPATAAEIPPSSSSETKVKQPMIAFCPKCGNKLVNPKEFCAFCGLNLSQ